MPYHRPPWLLWFHWLWLLKALKRLLKGFITIPNDRSILCNITKEKLLYVEACKATDGHGEQAEVTAKALPRNPRGY